MKIFIIYCIKLFEKITQVIILKICKLEFLRNLFRKTFVNKHCYIIDTTKNGE